MASEKEVIEKDGMLYFRIPKETENEFREIAKEQGKTPSKLGREMVLSYIEHYKANKEAKKLETVSAS